MEREMLYEERNGLLYPVVELPEDLPLGQVGKYGLLWLDYMKKIIRGGIVSCGDLAG